MKFVGRLLNGSCTHVPPAGAAPSPNPAPVSKSTAAFTLKASVGRGGVNKPEDVIAVQSALIQAGPANGGQSPDFPLDGQPNTRLYDAIQKFQIQHFGWSKADGLVEPNRQTHQKLNEFTGKTAAPALTGKVSVVLHNSVGQGGRNDAADVLQIQSALIQVGPAQGGTSPHAPLDGYCTPKLIEAIRRFQLKHFGWAGADGLITPYQQTHIRLNDLLVGGGAPVAAAVVGQAANGKQEETFNISFRLVLATSQRWILAAQAHCSSALMAAVSPAPKVKSPISALDPNRKLKLLDKHFVLGAGAQRVERIRQIAKVFDRMAMVFQRPGGLWGPKAFYSDPAKSKDLYAFTYAGGFFGGGSRTDFRGESVRTDGIYVSPPLQTLKTEHLRAFVIVHELAHFVGHPGLILDHGYNDNPEKMNKLSPWHRLHNAENYANFAAEAIKGHNAEIV